MLTKIEKAIALYEERLGAAIEAAGDVDSLPNAGLISQEAPNGK